ncbi:uncharacterized protein EDB91DRAFT_1257007 [Suillus paluster]|uniref:uncharacterized protein n=1 Tax=Suillus paluster TaxID=48578 RepID=UPI001B872FA6|nr:uncharacterized protein EDB91DRAFT_1257007 [Suillus paluster]KAG1720418.1 hypothetical protein EDB91DRAFT_1257007 [Suillus paluster]
MDFIVKADIHMVREITMHEEFARTSINAMFLHGDIQGTTMIEILSLCTGISNLALASNTDPVHKNLSFLQPVLDALPLTALHLQIGFTLTDSSIANVNVFSRLTHLDIDDHDFFQHVRIESFPRLTHLALWGDLIRRENKMASSIQRLLNHPTMQVILLRSDDHGRLADFLEEHAFNDPRIVIGPEKQYSWDFLGRGYMLLWEIAEAKAKILEPNHNKHRCFPPSTIVNGLHQCMDIESVRRRDVNFQLTRCIVIGRDMNDRTSRMCRVFHRYGPDDWSDDDGDDDSMSSGDSDSHDGSDEEYST